MTKKKSLALKKVTVQNLSTLPENHLEHLKGGITPKTMKPINCLVTPNSCRSCLC